MGELGACFRQPSHHCSPFTMGTEECGVKGESMFLIAESDDYAGWTLASFELRYQVRQASNGRIAYCQSGRLINDNTLSSMQEDSGFDEQRQKDLVNNGKDECSQSLPTFKGIPYASAVLIRRSFMKEWGAWKWDTLRLDAVGKMLLTRYCFLLPKPLNYYRTSIGSLNTAREVVAFWRSLQVIHYISHTGC